MVAQQPTINRNALARAQQALEQDKIPALKDLKLLEQMETPEADKILDMTDELKQQKSRQQESQRNTVQSQPVRSSSNQSKTSQSFEAQSPLESGSVAPTLERKKVLSGREKDYFQFFERRFGPLIVLILYFVMADLDKAVFYAPTPTECKEVAPHLARIGPKVEDLIHMPKWAHEAIVTSDSTFTVGMVLVGYLDRIGALEKIMPWMTSWVERSRNLAKEQTEPATSTGNVSSNGAGGVDRQFVPLEQLGVTGIGEQLRAEP